MDTKTKYLAADIKLSSFEGQFFKTEVMFEHHMLVWFISGETKIILADRSYVFKAGDIFLIPRNQLSTVIDYSTKDNPHQAVVMYLTQERLKNFYSKFKADANGKGKPLKTVYTFSKHPLLKAA